MNSFLYLSSSRFLFTSIFQDQFHLRLFNAVFSKKLSLKHATYSEITHKQ